MDFMKIGLIILGFLITFVISTIVVKTLTGFLTKRRDLTHKGFFDTGFFIGLFETIIVMTFVLVDQYTGLALIFTAKALVRESKIKENPEYYLVGTLANFTISLLGGIVLKYFLNSNW